MLQLSCGRKAQPVPCKSIRSRVINQQCKPKAHFTPRSFASTVGKFADLAVIDMDITAIDVSSISAASVTATYLQGELIFGSQTTASPTTAPCSCFSEAATVQVYGKGKIPMSRLQVDDKVYVGNYGGKDHYETVYAFGHHQTSSSVEYVQIHTNMTQGLPLELSPTHLLYINGKVDPVRADGIQAGDILLHQPMGSAAQAVRVTHIRRVIRKGAYMPLTKDGSIIVNELTASTYVSIADEAPDIVSKYKLILSEHNLLHFWLSPYRMMCLGVSSTLCEGDYSHEGIATWLVIGREVAIRGNDWWLIFQMVGLAVVSTFMAMCLAIELLARGHFVLLPAACVVGVRYLISRNRRASLKSKVE